MRASAETLQLIENYYRLLDEGRLDECESFFTPDATLKIAHHPEIVGWERIGPLMKGGLSNPTVRRIDHDVRSVWEEDDGTVIFEVDATYDLADGRTVIVPGVVIAEIENGRFRSQRIAADLSPVYL